MALIKIIICRTQFLFFSSRCFDDSECLDIAGNKEKHSITVSSINYIRNLSRYYDSSQIHNVLSANTHHPRDIYRKIYTERQTRSTAVRAITILPFSLSFLVIKF